MQQFATSRLEAGRLEIVSTALRANLPRVNESPADVAAILYSALRRDGRDDDEIEELLALGAMDLPLRIESYTAQTSEQARLRPPGPVAALHVSAGGALVVRCPHALLFDIGTTARTRRLTASALSADGALAITGDAEGTVSFWRMADGRTTDRAAAHGGEVTQIVVTNDAIYSCGAEGTVARWSVSGGGVSAEHHTTTARVTSAAAFGNEIALGCVNGDIAEISSSGTTIHAKAHDGAVTGIARDERGIYSAGADRKVRVCPAGRPDAAIRIDSGHALGIGGLTFDPETRFLVTYAADRTARLWSLPWTSFPNLISVRVLEHDSAVTAATIVRALDFTRLAIGTAGGLLYLYDTGGGLLRRQLRHRAAIRACAYRDEDELITGGDDRELVRSDLDLVESVDASVTACSSVPKAIGICKGGTFDVRYDGGAGGVGGSIATSIAMRDDGRRALVWRKGDDHVSEWDVSSAKERRVGEFSPGVSGAGYAGDVIAIALESGEVAFARGGGPVGRVWRVHAGPITAMTTTANGMVTAGLDGTIALTRPTGGSPLDEIGRHASRVTALAANERFIASGTSDGEIALWSHDEKRGPLVRIRHGASVTLVALASEILVTVADDHTATIWTFDGSRLVTFTGHRDRITALVFDERSQLLYTASLDRTVRAWSLRGEQRGIVYGDHPFSVLALVHGGIMAGEVLAGDDGGGVWTFSYRGDEDVETATPPVAPNPPRKSPKGQPAKRKSVKHAPAAAAKKKSSRSSSKKSSRSSSKRRLKK